MSTTSLKLPDELKSRIALLAWSVGMTPHAWMVTALATQAEQTERRSAFLHDALAAENEVKENGEVYRTEDVHDYLHGKLEGCAPPFPQAIKA